MGSLETCTHVILMPESHKILVLVLYGYVSFYYYLFLVLFWHAQTFILCPIFIFISPSLCTSIPPHNLFMTMTKIHKRQSEKREQDMNIK